MDKELFKNEEKAIFALRALYKQYGYLPFKMSKFEEYDLYVQNKDFLVSDRVITFNDTNGKLLALKPDVTLSIIKNTTFEVGCKQKVYYNENVYRVSPSTHQFKEIMQTGLECIGDIDLYDIFEVVYLGAKSLASVSEDFSLDISDMAIFSAILDSASNDEMFKKEITRLISEKNRHEALALCEKYSLDKESTDALVGLIGMYGEMSRVLEMLLPICKSEKAKDAYNRLSTLCTLLSSTEYASKIKLDFSVVNDMNYYNGIVFKGFLNGIPEGVLSGGEYGTLMRKMGRRSDAIGFALYLDTLEALDKSTRDFDVDVLLIYNDSTDASCIIEAKNKLIAQGKSVSAQKAIPQKLRYKELIDLTEGK
jgi:ATP phosphoribosyltransferase regulatory subunit